jgi:hypothetical protein
VTLAADHYFERLVVIVFANFTCRHIQCYARRELRGGVLPDLRGEITSGYVCSCRKSNRGGS